VFYALFKIDLKKRHCMLTTLGMDIVWPKKDQVIIEIPINAPEYQLPEGGSTTIIPVEMVITSMRNIK
jgi:hypothetical protein